MKMKRILAAVLVVSMMVVGLTACGTEKVTVDSLLDKLDSTKTESVSFDIDMSIAMSMALFGENSEMSAKMKMSVEAADNKSHVKGTTTTTSDGETDKTETEVYSEFDGKNYSVYTNEGEYWVKSTSDTPSTDLSGVNKIKDAVLREKKEKYDGVECYVIDGTLGLEDISSLSGNDIFDNFGDLDGVTVSATYYFDAKTKDLYAFEVEAGEAFSEMIQQAMMNEIGFSINIKISEFHIVISNLNFNYDGKITIPKEAYDAEVEWSWSDDDDDFDNDTPTVTPDKDDDNDEDGDYEEYDKVEWNKAFNELRVGDKTFDIATLTIKDLLDAGLKSDENIDGFTVNPGRTESVYFELDDWSYLSIGVMNTSDSAMSIEECPVYHVTVSLDEDDDVDVSLAGIKFFKDTESSLKTMFGQPTTIYRSAYLVSMSWETKDYNEFGVNIDTESGLVESASVYLYK